MLSLRGDWSGEMQNIPADRITGSHEGYLPALDGLRFTAAMLVAGGHYVGNLGQGILSETPTSFTELGVTLFLC
jgi:peptidoglycan/LPS O-acetylase OafA/YrhL